MDPDVRVRINEYKEQTLVSAQYKEVTSINWSCPVMEHALPRVD
jgi:hypothetical protein